MASARASGSLASPVRTLPLCRITRPRVAPVAIVCAVLPPPPPADEIARRIAAFQAGLRRDGLDAALIVQSADLVYLSGTAQNAHLVVPAEGEPLLLVRRDLERAREESALRRIEPFTSLRALSAALASAGLPERLRLGFELDVLPAGAYLRYCELLPGAEPADCMPALWSARSRKSGWELDRIRLACDQTRLAMEYAPHVLVPGRLECDVLSELGHHMRLAGHEGTIRFRGINSEFLFGQVLAGESAAVPGPDGDAAARSGAVHRAGPRAVAPPAARRATRS